MQDGDYSKYVFYHTPIIDGDYMWVSSIIGNGLYRIMPQREISEFIGFFPNEDFGQNFLHASSFKYKDSLIFIPFGGKFISTYNIENDSFRCYDLSNYREGSSSLFYSSIVDGRVVYLIPCRYEYIVRFDMETGNITEIPIFKNIDCLRNYNRKSPYILKGACKKDHQLFWGMYETDYFGQLDLETGYIQYRQIPYHIGGVSNMESVGQFIWIIGKNGDAIQYNPRNENFERYIIQQNSEKRHYGVFFESYKVGRKLVLTSADSSALYVFDTEKKDSYMIPLGQVSSESWRNVFPVRLLNLYEKSGEIRILDANGGKTYALCLDKFEELHVINATKQNEINYDTFANKIGMSAKKNWTHEQLRLPTFLNYVIHKDENSSIKEMDTCSNRQMIHESLRGI